MSAKILQAKLQESFDKHKDRTAIEYGNRVVSYAELDKNSADIAEWIMNKGIGPGTFIGILVEDRLDLIAIIIGIIKAGCVFVPFYSAHPTKRIEIMLETTHLKYLFTDQANRRHFRDTGQEMEIFLVRDIYSRVKDRQTAEKPGIIYSGEDPVYIYFTSGTTGVPKAVVGKNKSLLHFIEWEIDTFFVDCTSRLSQFIIPPFDPYLRDVFVPLLAGGVVVIPRDRDIMLDAASLRDWINDHGITMIHCVTSLFRLLCRNSLSKGDFKTLRSIMLAGEKTNPSDLEYWYRVFGDRVQLANAYGPTETTLVKICHLISPDDIHRERIPIGKPIRGARVIILDENRDVCDELEVGEITIRTPFRSCGYYNDPELNRRKFIPNPFNDDPDDIIYLTGDLGRILPDGNIDILGRVDRQVKIRGMRIELDEIERTLIKQPEVQEAVVLKFEIANNNEILYAFITVLGSGLSPEPGFIENLKRNLAVTLPDYMVPAVIEIIEKIPLRSNGKVDYELLAEQASRLERDIVAPRSDIEKKIFSFWAEILEYEKFGVTNSFLEVGGNSLTIMSLLSKIHKEFNIRVSVADIFDNITIEKQAKLITGLVRENYISINPVEKKEYYPLSAAQNRLYILQQMDSDSTAYNIQKMTVLGEKTDKLKMTETFRQLLVRHESLRTSFRMISGEPVQIVHDPEDLKFEIESYEEAGKEKPAAAAFIRPFDLSCVPLLRVGLPGAAENGLILAVDIHHIISDGLSIDLLTREFVSLYRGDVLSPIRINYRDYALWQNNFKKQDTFKKQEQYWLREFSGDIPVLDNMPGDFKRPAVFTFEGHTVSFRHANTEVEALRKLSRDEGVTLFMLLLAIFNVLIGKISGREDVVIGIPIAGRAFPDLERVIGMFVNTLALRNYPHSQKIFSDFLAELRQRTIVAFDNQDYQFEDLVDKVSVRDTGRNPLFDVLFVLNTLDKAQGKNSSERQPAAGVYRERESSAKFDLTLNVTESETDLFFTFQYRTRIFKEETMKRIIEYFKNILTSIIARPRQKIGDIHMIPEEERARAVFAFNDTDGNYLPFKTVHEIFREQVARTPDRIAILGPGEGSADINSRCGVSMTYHLLDGIARKLAAILLEKGVAVDTIAGVEARVSIAMVISILAIWKAGGAYLPIDPDIPVKRKEYLLKDSGAKHLLTTRNVSETVDKSDIPEVATVFLDEGFGDLIYQNHIPEETPNLESKRRDEFLAAPCAGGVSYAIYTSGSTGRPKGVLVRHFNITNQMMGLQKKYAFVAGLHHILLAPFTFDPSVQQIFLPLISGGKLHLVGRSVKEDPAALLSYIVLNRMDIVNTVPSLMELLLNHTGEYEPLHFKYIILAGEIFSAGLLRKIRNNLTVDKLINIYGPTEATINTTLYECGTEEDTIPIGKPLMNYKVFILDKNLQVTPLGVAGEICITGAGIAAGYLNNPELTVEKFVQNPFSKQPGKAASDVMYRTGDLGKWLPDGNILFEGRIDRQVKIRGIRVELEEIEKQLLLHTGIRQAVIIAKKYKGDSADICAYYTVRQGAFSDGPGQAGEEAVPGVSELRKFLYTKLPDFMIPSYFLQLNEIPLTKHGKVDFKKLPEIGPDNIKLDTEYVAPVSEIEKTIAAIWQDILKLEKVGIDDNFFELGGNSLDIIKVNARLKEISDKNISVVSMFRYTTIRSLTTYFSRSEEENKTAGSDRSEVIERGKRDRNIRLQKRKGTIKN